MNLESHLAKPWQRVMKYELLLREIRERAEPAERAKIIQTIEEIREINSGLNKSQAQSDNQKLLLEKQKYYGLKDLSAPARYFVRDGMLKIITSTKKKEISFVLCNDILLYGKRSGTLTQAQFKQVEVHLLQIIRHPEGESKSFILQISPEEGLSLLLFCSCLSSKID